MKSMRVLFIVVAISLAIALFWNQIPIIQQTVHAVLNPTAGRLLDWNPPVGIILFSAIIALFITIIQKYATDQETLRQIKKEQKELQAQMKQYKEHPEKLMELQKISAKKAFEVLPHTMRPMMYTSVPIILFFRWFNDYFTANPIEFFGFLSWFWAYFILTIIFSSIFRKVFNVA